MQRLHFSFEIFTLVHNEGPTLLQRIGLSCSLLGLRRPFRGVRGSWPFRLLRRPASRCRGTLRPPASAQLHLHTCVKGSAQAVKPDVCRCAAFKKKVISLPTVSTTIVSIIYHNRFQSDCCAAISQCCGLR